ncbi:MAG: GMC family oxidoreductase N-terminal domain-containing protein [Alphaproteobacteria bacterium]
MTFINVNATDKIYKADLLIIGSGAGGATIADIATQHGMDVLMVEEGEKYPIKQLKTPEEVFIKLWRNSGLTATLGKPNIAFAEGKTFGGSTEINSAIFQRPHEQVVKNWQSAYQLDDSWSYKNLLRYWDKSFSQMHVSYHKKYYADSDVLIKGAAKLNYAAEYLSIAMKPDEKDDRIYGNPIKGKRSMSNSLLPLALKRGMRVILGCRVNRLSFKGKKAVRAYCDVKKNNTSKKLVIEFKYVFCCAGSIHTPMILKKSGVRSNLPFDNFQLHPTLKMFGLFPKKIQTAASMAPGAFVSEFMPDIRLGGSIFTRGFVGMALANNYDNASEFLQDMDYVGSYYVMIKPTAKGRFHFLPMLDSPLINYKLAMVDFANLKKGMGYLAEIMFAYGAKKVMPDIAGHRGWHNMADVKKDSSRTENYNLMSIHLMGSCPPSGNRQMGITDQTGLVWGYDNFYIADGSQVPTAMGCNPQATIMAIAKKYGTEFIDKI